MKQCHRSLILLSMMLGPLVMLSMHDAHGSKIKPVEYTCPIGGAKFTQTMVLSGTHFGRRLDTRPYGRIVSPFPLPLCKSNGFVIYQDEFTADELAKLAPIVRSKAYQDLRTRHSSYYLAGYLRERMGATDLDVGYFYLKASWQAEGAWSPGGDTEKSVKDRTLVQEYRALALRKLEAFLSQDESRSSEWWNAAVLAAELERLLSRFPQAEMRIERLLGNTTTASRGQQNAIAQIRAHASAQNAEPQVLTPARTEP